MLVRANRKHSLVDGWFNIHRASGLSLQACPGPVQNLAGGGSGHVADAGRLRPSLPFCGLILVEAQAWLCLMI